MVILALMGAGLLAACGDDATSTTAPSVASGDAELRGLASVRSHGDGRDDDSSDDDGSGDGSGGDARRFAGDDDRVRGLFFGMEGCPAAEPECVLAVRIKNTLVVVTETTRIDNESALVEDLTPAELQALLTDRIGLPLRARGVISGGDLVASELRIDDEVRASGLVIAPAPKCESRASSRWN